MLSSLLLIRRVIDNNLFIFTIFYIRNNITILPIIIILLHKILPILTIFTERSLSRIITDISRTKINQSVDSFMCFTLSFVQSPFIKTILV